MNFRKERTVNFYAERLNITHGHLSTTVKSVTGKTPLRWIEEYVAKEACALLHSSTLTFSRSATTWVFPHNPFSESISSGLLAVHLPCIGNVDRCYHHKIIPNAS